MEQAPPFLNQVIGIETTLNAFDLLQVLFSIENTMGRTRQTGSYESRIIDIDLLLYGQEVISENGLIIPHPRIAQRKFVLLPLDEIAPEQIHPVYHKTIGQLLSECTDAGWVKKCQYKNA
jgi:2-amino-4-hydroxy-6-hydroxymethyldihydropteridine diphosphokinase